MTDYNDKEKIRQELKYLLGREPTDAELDLELNIRIIDSAGGHTLGNRQRHRRGKGKKK